MITIFVPIRKNSKRIKKKNIKKLGSFKFGLTELKFKQLENFKKKIKNDKILKKIKFEFIVSSDDLIIKKILNSYKWIKFHHRPSYLSSDNSLDKLIKFVPKICAGKYLLWTHVTSPFFDEKSYIRFIKIFLKNSKIYNSAFSANKISSFIYNSSKKKWISHNRNVIKWPRTQDLDLIWEINSAAFIADREVYTKYKDRIDNNPLPIISLNEESFDVDDMDDFRKLKKIIKNV